MLNADALWDAGTHLHSADKQRVHSSAVNTGHYVKPVHTQYIDYYYPWLLQINTSSTPPLHLQFSPSFPFLICALQVCSENSWCITEGTCCSLRACLWVCVCEDKVRGKNSENHYSLLTHDSAGVAWLSNLSHLNYLHLFSWPRWIALNHRSICAFIREPVLLVVPYRARLSGSQ